jgi:hypothetical protein
LILWQDAETELTRPDLGAEYDVARIITESVMLETRNAAIGRPREGIKHGLENISKAAPADEGRSMVDATRIGTLTSDRPQISLQDMIATSVVLKSNIAAEILEPSSPWPSALLSAPPTTPSKEKPPLLPQLPSSSEGEIPPHVVQAISGLQREVHLLRNELNFELWLSKENVKHIGRLYQNRILSKNTEAERQGLVR